MELITFLNEPAIVGTTLFVAACSYVYWTLLTPTATERLATLDVVLTLLRHGVSVLGLAVLLHFFRTADVSILSSVSVVAALIALATYAVLQQQGTTQRERLQLVVWQVGLILVSACLLWYWPW